MASFFEKLKNLFVPRQTPAFIASQLRRPHGLFAHTIAQRMNESNHNMYELLFQHLEVKAHDCILEIGFGNGRFFKALANKVESLEIYGIDFSKAMLKEAQSSNADLIDQGQLHLQLGNSEKLPFKSEFFDQVFCLNVIYFWPKPFTHLQEIRRVLKPGARFYVRIRPKEVMEAFPFTAHGFHLRSTEEIKSIFAQSGFELLAMYESQETPVTIYGSTYPMGSLCMVFERS